MTFNNISFEVKNFIALITINRPEKLNALNDDTISELDRAIDAVYLDSKIKSIALTGSGNKAFVAGADIKELNKLNAIQARETALRGQRVFSKFESCPKPTLALVNGFAFGGGCELAMSFHFRFASENNACQDWLVKAGRLN